MTGRIHPACIRFALGFSLILGFASPSLADSPGPGLWPVHWTSHSSADSSCATRLLMSSSDVGAVVAVEGADGASAALAGTFPPSRVSWDGQFPGRQ